MKKILNLITKYLNFKGFTIFAGLIFAAVLTVSSVNYLNWIERGESYQNLLMELEDLSSNFKGDVGIYIKDLKTGHTVEINSDKLFPSASLVKVPIMAAVFKAQAEGRLSLEDKMRLSWKHKVWSRRGLYRARSGKKFKIEEIMKRMIARSDNTATNMLVDRLGFGYINTKFIEFGLLETDLKRGVMELKWRKHGIENYTTPKEMAYLLEQIYKGKLVNKDASSQMLEILKSQRVNDRIPKRLPKSLKIAHKTGSLNDTISDVGIVYTSKGNFIICVLTEDIRSWRKAKNFIAKVATKTYEYYSKT